MAAAKKKPLPAAHKTPAAKSNARKPVLTVVKKAPPAVSRKSVVVKQATRGKAKPPSRKSAAPARKTPKPAAKKIAARQPSARKAQDASRRLPAKGKKPAAAARKVAVAKKPAPASARKVTVAKKPAPAAARKVAVAKKPAPPAKRPPTKSQTAAKISQAKITSAKPAPAAAGKPLPVTAKAPPKPVPVTAKPAPAKPAPAKLAPTKTAATKSGAVKAKPSALEGDALMPSPPIGPSVASRPTPAPALTPIPVRATQPITPIMPRAPIASWIKKPTPPVRRPAAAKKPPVKLGPLVRLTAEDYRPVPVKHQRWTIRDVAVAAPGDRPAWRVSLTRILQDCDFSHFERMDRTIMMIDGLGLELDFGGNGTALLDRRYNPVEFRGEWSTRCRLVSGPVEVINVITDRRRVTHHVTVMALGMNERLRDLKGEASIIFCLVGEAELVLGKERFVLAAGETLRSTVRGRIACRAASTSALIYVVEVKKR